MNKLKTESEQILKDINNILNISIYTTEYKSCETHEDLLRRKLVEYIMELKEKSNREGWESALKSVSIYLGVIEKVNKASKLESWKERHIQDRP